MTSTTYSYDAWGTQSTTALNGSTISNYQIYGFAGGTTDPSTNEHFGHRWYYSKTARFTQQDDINTLADPGRANRYEYAGDNPVNYVDPSGRLALNLGGSICFIACVEGTISIGTSGISATSGGGGGFAIGPELTASVSSGDGVTSGMFGEVDCSGPGLTGAVSATGETSLGLSTATEYGCSAYVTQSSTLVTY